MEVSNASHYDGASAIAEAVSMAFANFRGKRNEIVISPTLNPQYRETIQSYHQGSNLIFYGESLPPNSVPEDLFRIY